MPPCTSYVGQQISSLWEFLGVFQKPFARILHAVLVVLVLVQIASSAGMGITDASIIQTGFWIHFAVWLHIIVGIFLIPITLVQVVYSLKNKGVRHFFPYLWGDMEQIKKDIAKSLQFKIVAPRPKGLASTVQGLGLGALLLAVGSGTLWCYLWATGTSSQEAVSLALESHKVLVYLIIFYLFGHGGMALLHFVTWQKSTQRSAKNSGQ